MKIKPGLLASRAEVIDRPEILYYTSPMPMGRLNRDRQAAMWVPTTHLPTPASHPFYRRLNELLREHGFDDFVELSL